VVARAQSQEGLILSRHLIEVCPARPSGNWTDRCSWDTPPTFGAHVIVPFGARIILDTQPPPLSSLTVSACFAMESAKNACSMPQCFWCKDMQTMQKLLTVAGMEYGSDITDAQSILLFFAENLHSQ
jgi:hypothetical protein